MDRLRFGKKNDDSDRKDDKPRSTPAGANRGVPSRGFDRNDALDRLSDSRGGRVPDAKNEPVGRSLRSPFGGGDKTANNDKDAAKDKGAGRFGSLLGRGGKDKDEDKPAKPTGRIGTETNAGRPGSKGSPAKGGKGSPEPDKGGGRFGSLLGRGGKDKDDDKGKDEGKSKGTSPFVTSDRGAPGGTANRPDLTRTGYQRPVSPDTSATGDRRYSTGSDSYNRPGNQGSTNRPSSQGSTGVPGSAPRSYGGTSSSFGTGASRYGAPSSDDDDESPGDRRPGSTSPGAPRSYGSTSPFGSPPANRYGGTGTTSDDDESNDRSYGSGSTGYNRPTGTTSPGGTPTYGGANRPVSREAGTPSRLGGTGAVGSFGTRDSGAKSGAGDKAKEEKPKSGGIGGFLRRSKGQEEDKAKEADKSKDAVRNSASTRSLTGGTTTSTRPPIGSATTGITGTQAKTSRGAAVAPPARPDVRTGGKEASRGDAATSARAKESTIGKTSGAATARSERPVAKPLGATKAKGALTVHQGLDFNRKIDMVGLAFVAFAFVGFFAVAPSMSFGVLPTSHGGVTGTLDNLLSQLFGWGKIAVPLAVGAIGIWLMAQRFDEVTGVELDYIRIVGMLLLFACVLTWLQFAQLVDDTAPSVEVFRPVSYDLAVEVGEGGGWIGHQIYLFLLTQLGDYGTIGVLIPWIVVALMLTFDLSVVELVGHVTAAFGFLKFTSREERIARRRAKLAMKSGEIAVNRPGEIPNIPVPATALSATTGAAAGSAATPSAAQLPARTANRAASPMTGAANATTGTTTDTAGAATTTASTLTDPARPPVRPGPATSTSTVSTVNTTGTAATTGDEELQVSRRRLPHLPHLQRGSSSEASTAETATKTAAAASSTASETSAASEASSKRRMGGLFGRKGTADQSAAQTAALTGTGASKSMSDKLASDKSATDKGMTTPTLADSALAARTESATDSGTRGMGRFFRRGSDQSTSGEQATATDTPAASRSTSAQASERALASPFTAPVQSGTDSGDRASAARERFAARTPEQAGDRSSERTYDRPSDRTGDRSSERTYERPSDRVSERTFERPADRAQGRSSLTTNDSDTNDDGEDRASSGRGSRGLGSAIAGVAAGAIVGSALRALSDSGSDDDATVATQAADEASTSRERASIQRSPFTSAAFDALDDSDDSEAPAEASRPASKGGSVSPFSSDNADDDPLDGWGAATVPDLAGRARRRSLSFEADGSTGFDRSSDDNGSGTTDDEDRAKATADSSPPAFRSPRPTSGQGDAARPDASRSDSARFQRPTQGETDSSAGAPISGTLSVDSPAAGAPIVPVRHTPAFDAAETLPRVDDPDRTSKVAPMRGPGSMPAATTAAPGTPAGTPFTPRGTDPRTLPGRSLPGANSPNANLSGASRPDPAASATPAAPDTAASTEPPARPAGMAAPGAASTPGSIPPRGTDPRTLPGRSLPGASTPGTGPLGTGARGSTPAVPPAPVRPGESRPNTLQPDPTNRGASDSDAAARTEPPARPVGLAAQGTPPRVDPHTLPGRSLPGAAVTAGTAADVGAGRLLAAAPAAPTPAVAASGAPSAGTPTAGAPEPSVSSPEPPRIQPTPHGTPIVRRHTAPEVAQTTDATKPAPTASSGATVPSVTDTGVTRRVPVPRVAEDDVDEDEAPTEAASATRKARNGWDLPDYRQLLRPGDEQRINDEVLLDKARVIEDTLMSFGAPGKVVEVNPGPVITQFGVEPDYLVQRSGKKTRVKVNQIARLDADLALSLAAKTIRIEAPVPGKGYVGIEVPNDEVVKVGLRDVMDSHEFRRVNSRLRIALGLGVDGTPVTADLTAMPHLLIAGTTGSGKSVCVNSIISCLLLTNKPDEVQFIMVDPKRVELTGYNGVPHLVAPVVVDLERIVGVLQWVQREMEERYRKFAASSSRNIVDYNGKLPPGTPMMPYYVVVVDELADLMMLAPDETERLLARLAQMARATGIHLIISTQRPSVDVVTGLIKANFPARIAFAVASSVDSRVILDQPGAEKLLGRGDMLFQSPDAAAPLRMQGVFVGDEEINAITRYWKTQALNHGGEPGSTDLSSPRSSLPSSSAPARYDSVAMDSAEAARRKSKPSHTSPQQGLWSDQELDEAAGSGPDDMYGEAVELVQRLNKASISLLQRRLRIGYTRAARLIDLMEQDGIIGPAQEGSKPREVINHIPTGSGSASASVGEDDD